jgi:hypothetical protein
VGSEYEDRIRTKKPVKPTARKSTLGIYLLRAAELGITVTDLGDYTLGEITDMIIEKANDYEEYPEVMETQDIHRFFG